MIRRREFMAGLGSTAVLPLVARGQQASMPVIGFLSSRSADDDYKYVTVPFLQGLCDGGPFHRPGRPPLKGRGPGLS
jgi:hypothetical protein